MEQELDKWNKRLASHFRELADKRITGSEPLPVFALEHGLTESEVVSISEAVCVHIRSRSPSNHLRLPWIVYATELGYQYSGNEYWQTFEAKTPGWIERGKRSWIRECFQWFCNEYGGATPTGKWAEHFTIICWPITNAVLPKDLQRQLAHVLYRIRHSYSQEILESPLLLGQLIVDNGWNESHRFQNFAQEIPLVGQIASALLLEEDASTRDLLSRPTLQRIRGDLDNERQRREWLRIARQSAKERRTVRGFIRDRLSINKQNTKKELRELIETLGIEPRLVLTPNNTENTSWDLSVEIPDFSNLCQRFPNTQHTLRYSRCRIVGNEDRPIARGRFLHGAQRIKLDKWPNADEVLLRFEEKNPDLEFLLRAECMFRPGPPWLFRIASDIVAYECRGLGVRPGQQYVILTTTETQMATAADGIQPVDIQCRGIHGILLNLPDVLSSHMEGVIQGLRLNQSRLIKAQPAGLAPVHWDGDGYSEWVEGERPTFAIWSDHHLGMVRMRLDDFDSTTMEFNEVTLGEPLFVELPRLPSGLHTMHVDIVTADVGDPEKLGHLKIRVNKKQQWPQGLNPSGPLSVHMDPVVPTLEEIWDGRVDVEILGPKGRVVQCGISLMNRHKEKPVVRIPTSLKLPITANQWKAHFEKHFRKKEDVIKKYDAAHACQMDFIADELGAFTIRCEREFSPLRWVLENGQGWKPVLYLINDNEIEEDVQVSYYTFKNPAKEVFLEYASKYEVTAPGGLYLAKWGEFSKGIIVALRRIKLFSDLSYSPVIDHQDRSLDAVMKAIILSCEWTEAKSSGDTYSAENRRKSLRVLINHIVVLIAGTRWAKAESYFEKSRDLSALAQAVQKDEGRIGISLTNVATKIAQESVEKRVSRLAKLATRYGVLHRSPDIKVDQLSPEWVTEFALRLGSSPKDAKDWAGSNLRGGVGRLMSDPNILRLARFVILTTHYCTDSDENYSQIFKGWKWT